VADVQDTIEVALGGKPITSTVEGPERYPVRLRYARDYRVDEESIKRILVAPGAAGGMSGPPEEMGGGMAEPAAPAGPPGREMPAVHLSDVADVRVVEGPVMIKSENGLLRSYVQLNVRDRDIVGFVEEARRVVEARVKFPEGSHVEWSGQFEHQVRARKTLMVVFPAVLLLILLILYLTYHDFAHALLMMMAVPGALAGGVIFQTIFGYNFSVAVWVGYIACFGMATETGIIMLVYLRDAIAERGGLAGIADVAALKEAIIAGAVHRLRPKLLTEGTAIVGLAPMLWAGGTGAEVIAPMAAPVLGGLLIADEVIDIFLPVLFYKVEAYRWRKLHAQPATSAPAQPD
jgi:Cu(I)/Ag(I) efflux system membrane protein CusA/SilA